jgi:tetratricopeptide (TPR) repeat protein
MSKWLLAMALVLALGMQSVYAAASWDALTEAGEKAYKKKDYTTALKNWNQALTVAENLKEWDPKLPETLDHLAMVYKMQEKYAESEKYYRRAFELRKKHLVKGDPRLAMSVINVASVMASAGNYKQANSFYDQNHDYAAAAAAMQCYMCDQNKIIPIIYGNSTPQLKTLEKRGIVKLGGAFPKGKTLPRRWFCVNCDAPL